MKSEKAIRLVKKAKFYPFHAFSDSDYQISAFISSKIFSPWIEKKERVIFTGTYNFLSQVCSPDRVKNNSTTWITSV